MTTQSDVLAFLPRFAFAALYGLARAALAQARHRISQASADVSASLIRSSSALSVVHSRNTGRPILSRTESFSSSRRDCSGLFSCQAKEPSTLTTRTSRSFNYVTIRRFYMSSKEPRRV